MSIEFKPGDVVEALLSIGWRGKWSVTMGCKYIVFFNDNIGLKGDNYIKIMDDTGNLETYIVDFDWSQYKVTNNDPYLMVDNPNQTNIVFKKV